MTALFDRSVSARNRNGSAETANSGRGSEPRTVRLDRHHERMKDDARIETSDLELVEAPAPRHSARRRAAKRPEHYKVICISMYTRDIEALDAKVAELKRRGWTKANKSQMIRLALSQLDLDKAVGQARTLPDL